MNSFQNSDKKKFKWAILLSLIIHVSFFSKNITISNDNQMTKENKTEQKIRLKFKRPSKKLQIVNTQLKSKKEKAKDAKYLSKFDQKFMRQTVAKTLGKFKKAGVGSKKGIDSKRIIESFTKKSVQENKSDKKKDRRKMKLAKNKVKKIISLGDLSLAKFTPTTKKQRPRLAKGLKNGEKGKSGLASNNDFIEDIPLGDATNLNTLEFKYYGFYFRIRQKLEQHWGNTLKNKARRLFKKGRTLASDENHITSLKITLDDRGNIVDILIKGTSGVSELDNAAIESFNKAGPFPNPPKGMLSNGRAQIEWGFVVKS